MAFVVRRFGRGLFVLIAALLLCGTVVRAQSTAQTSGTVSDANFGRYLQADDPRIMQFALKYQF